MEQNKMKKLVHEFINNDTKEDNMLYDVKGFFDYYKIPMNDEYKNMFDKFAREKLEENSKNLKDLLKNPKDIILIKHDDMYGTIDVDGKEVYIFENEDLNLKDIMEIGRKYPTHKIVEIISK